MNVLDNLQIRDNADGSQDLTIEAFTTVHVGNGVKVSKSPDQTTLQVQVTYKVKVAFFNVTRTSTIYYNPSTGMLRLVA